MARLGLTTTLDRGRVLADRCEEIGLEPILLPCIEQVPADQGTLRSAMAEAEQADWLVVTSPRAVTTLWPEGAMPATRIAAVGPATARAVHRAGGTISVTGRGGAADLVGLLRDAVRGRKVVFPHAARAGGTTIAALEAAGASLVAIPVYEVRPISPPPDPVEAVAFGSPSAVSGWALSRTLEGPFIGAIGETTAAALVAHGVEPDVMPSRPSFDDLIYRIGPLVSDRSPA